MIRLIVYISLVNAANQILCLDVLPKVKTHLGSIKGSYKIAYSGRQFEAYEGIPYAEPPTGALVFEPPVPVSSWNDALNATKPGNSCIQYSNVPKNPENPIEGSKDCLYLNVYVPKHDKNSPLPVLFFIHGGAYQYGKGSTGVKFLMDRDIIFVSINYRVGIFGFLSTEDDVVPGNMGLKDQSLALRWVSENIKYFNGDPKKITIMGQSAGAASVHYHYLSPMSRGLFRNGISFSGTAFGPGKQTENSREKAKELAALLGCQTENIPEMIECLRSTPAESVIRLTKHFMPFLYNPFTPFGPVVEKHGKNPFINRTPIEILSNGDAADLPWVNSIVSEDGLYTAAEFVNNPKYLKDLDENWDTIAPHLLDYNFTIPLKDHAEVAAKIRKHYLESKAIGESTVAQMIAMVGDRLYGFDNDKATRLQAKMNKSPVYFWYYSYRALTSFSDYFTKSKKNYGVSHADDINMIVENIFIDATKRPEDRAMQVKLIDFVVSMAEKGYPDFGLDFEWKKVDPDQDELEYLHVAGPRDMKMEKNNNLAAKNFWSTIDFDENKLPQTGCNHL